MDLDDLKLFTASVQQAVLQPGVDAALADLGWTDALADDAASAVPAVFTELGAAAATCSALPQVLAHGLGVEGWAVLPALGSAEPPGTLASEGVAVQGLLVGGAPAEVLQVAAGGQVVSVRSDQLALTPVAGLDPAAQVVAVSGTAAVLEATESDGWDAAVRLGRLALAHELVGASRTMLALARTHALDRVQFGVPIASFQAVRHRLAEAFIAIEAADGLAASTWESDDAVMAAMAKGLAGRSARTTSRHAQQVLAGIGFTTEHRFHLYARRVLLLDQLLGSSRSLTAGLGQQLLTTRRLPALQPL